MTSATVGGESKLAADVVFGIQASTLLAERLFELLRHWAQNWPTLRPPLPDAPRLVHRLRNVIWDG